MKNSILIVLSLFFSVNTWAAPDVTEGKPLIPWVWEDQLKPTIERSWDQKGMAILAGGIAATVGAHQYDDTVRRHNLNGENKIFGKDTANLGGYLGSGGPGIALAMIQLYVDPENGLQHSRALALTAANHIALAGIINRHRPNERDYLSMPSGHASSAFATATSLAYSYGWQVGVPAYLTAGFIAATRVSDNIHWLSDVTAAAALGIYWGRASSLVTEDRAKTKMPVVMPIPLGDGGLITATWDF